ncbi:MAG: tetratricopeptide repeat protein, partial [Bacteroidales bacterium]|nr:tetratricopeptide repeat protein [Bacteroidales bacterium]
MRKLAICMIAFLTFASLCSGQSERSQVRSGNRNFKKEKYQEAEIKYKKALLADSLSNAANYNLGNTYYKMDNYTEADKCYAAVADSLAKMKNGADMYHNMGNSLLAQKNYKDAIEAYKNSLRRNPSDMETKSNLAYA